MPGPFLGIRDTAAAETVTNTRHHGDDIPVGAKSKKISK